MVGKKGDDEIKVLVVCIFEIGESNLSELSDSESDVDFDVWEFSGKVSGVLK